MTSMPDGGRQAASRPDYFAHTVRFPNPGQVYRYTEEPLDSLQARSQVLSKEQNRTPSRKTENGPYNPQMIDLTITSSAVTFFRRF